MEVPIISRINPTFFISRLIDLFKSSASPQRSTLKWAALLLVFLFFTFTNIASRLKLLLFHPFSPISKTPLSSINLYDDDVSDDDDSPRSSDEDKDDDEDEDEFEKAFPKKGDYDFGYTEGQKGKFTRCRRGSFGKSITSLTELLTGNVVKFWDDYDYDHGYDSDSDYNHGPFSGGFAAVASPAGVVVSADTGDYNKLGVNLWDARVRRRRPAVHAEWSRRRPTTSVVGVGVGEGKIYVSDDVEGERLVGDMRMVDSPLTFDDVEDDDDAWWDADAVNGTE